MLHTVVLLVLFHRFRFGLWLPLVLDGSLCTSRALFQVAAGVLDAIFPTIADVPAVSPLLEGPSTAFNSAEPMLANPLSKRREAVAPAMKTKAKSTDVLGIGWCNASARALQAMQ